jgi:hypothetical protein
MSKRTLVVALIFVLTAVLAGAVACGGGKDSTTTTASTLGSLEPTSVEQAGGAATTRAGGTSGTSGNTTSSDTGSTEVSASTTTLAMTPDLDVYKTEMTAWGKELTKIPEAAFLSISDPNTATPEDVKQAKDFSAYIHTLLDKLKGIKPPAAISQTHNAFVKAFGDEVKISDDFVNALKKKDAAGMKAATESAGKLDPDLERLSGELAPYLNLQ